MTGRQVLVAAAAAIALAALPGCASYDYLQRTDRIGYHAGDAVQANLERETTDPTGWWMYDTTGLGRNGAVTSAGTSTATTAAPAAAATPQATPTTGTVATPPPG